MARKAPDQDAGEALRRFKSDLKAGTLGNFYIISGEEAFLRFCATCCCCSEFWYRSGPF